ncbi:MAG: serine acetyltransferase [Alphaproteobacteria bacterium]|nr:serine acetyltransferase [Alphaproteobacteria bacterium]
MPDPTNTSLDAVLDALVESYREPDPLNALESAALPNRRAVIEAFHHLQHLLFLPFFSTRMLSENTLRMALAEHLLPATELLCAQVSRAAAWADRDCRPADRREEGWCRQRVFGLLNELPALRETLQGDVRAAFEADPAAEHIEDIVFSYPAILAITAYRVAHVMFESGVPIIPRILTEHAHQRTGIDIHPGATIGPRFFIDHGTGVVIGATTVVGADVRIYQGVTLGAHSVRGDVERRRGRIEKRHPTLEDRVTVYAGATILGGDTVVGAGSVIGGNVWLTESVPPGSKVFFRPTKTQQEQR